jgi:hypothetical protein
MLWGLEHIVLKWGRLYFSALSFHPTEIASGLMLLAKTGDEWREPPRSYDSPEIRPKVPGREGIFVFRTTGDMTKVMGRES